MSELINSIIGEFVAPALKSAGFKKSGMTWNRRLDGVVHVVDLQSTAKEPRRVEFTFNFGIWLEEVWKICWAKDSPRLVHEHDCFPRFRVGQALEGFPEKARDKWWSVSAGESAAEIGEEVQDAVFRKCLPVFERLRNSADALAFARGRVPIRLPLEALYFAILRYLNGEEDQATAALLELSSDSHWGKRAVAILERLREAG